ncbi:hypothetical protein RHECNPAF_1740032 [Rhizobium etli CNPAF512]|nr:hypothetical protein RHECNPAF_1740032 [Rhizobium etli CNPAF512]
MRIVLTSRWRLSPGRKIPIRRHIQSCSQSRFRIVTGVSSGDVLPVSCGDGGCKH